MRYLAVLEDVTAQRRVWSGLGYNTQDMCLRVHFDTVPPIQG
jgi:hypothetical protein